jgi:hypothetical protein
VRNEEKDRSWRRLFERFQKGVGGVDVQVVGGVNNDNAAAALFG